MTLTLDTTRPAATDALAEAWHAVGADGDDHALRTCLAQVQADIWSDVAQWMTYLAGRPLALDESGVPLLAEAMHADCFRRADHHAHALAKCPSKGPNGIQELTPRDAREIIGWLAAKPARTAGAQL
jgi:hypothetical protein